MEYRIEKVISGGQTGIDQLGLKVAKVTTAVTKKGENYLVKAKTSTMTKGKRAYLDKAKRFGAFVNDITEVMQKHGITDLLAFYELEGEFRNTYFPLHPDGEKQLYCFLSDATNVWMLQHGYAKSPKQKKK